MKYFLVNLLKFRETTEEEEQGLWGSSIYARSLNHMETIFTHIYRQKCIFDVFQTHSQIKFNVPQVTRLKIWLENVLNL